MNSSEGFIAAAGALSFAGNWKDSGGFPENGYKIVAATVALVVLAAFARNTPVAGPVKGLAGLMLLAAAIRYIPGLASNKVRKTHG